MRKSRSKLTASSLSLCRGSGGSKVIRASAHSIHRQQPPKLSNCTFKKQQNSDAAAAEPSPSPSCLLRKPRTSKSETKCSFKLLKTDSEKLVRKYPDRFYSSNTKTDAAAAAAKVGVVGNDLTQRTASKIKFKGVEGPSSKGTKSAPGGIEIVEDMTKTMSLMDQKKLQWEKEREEMNGLFSPWGRPSASSVSVPQAINQSGVIVGRDTLNDISNSCLQINCNNRLPSAVSLSHSHSHNSYHLPSINVMNGHGHGHESNHSMKSPHPQQYHQITVTTTNGNGNNNFGSSEFMQRNLHLAANTNANAKPYGNGNGSSQVNYYNNEPLSLQQQRLGGHGHGHYYDDERVSSGYQSESGGFASRHDSGDGNGSGKGMMVYREHNLNRQPAAPAVERSKSHENFQITAPFQPLPLPAHAMRSSFAIGEGISDSGYIEKIQEKEKAQWLRDLKLQMEEQKQQKDVEEKRGRWGDKGICVGHFWEPADSDSRLPPNSAGNSRLETNPPAWASEKSFYRPHTSQSQPCLADPNVYYENIGQHHQQQQQQEVYYMNQSVTDLRNVVGLNGVGVDGRPQQESTFLRGHNVPVDPEMMHEKERKRVAALEHQRAILQQIEERQMKLKQEHVQRMRQEQMDEQRIREQQLKLLERTEMEARLKEQQQLNDDDENTEFDKSYTSNSNHQKQNQIQAGLNLVSRNTRLLQQYQRDSNEILEYQHARSLANEFVQTEPTLEPDYASDGNSNREFGTQTEVADKARLQDKEKSAQKKDGKRSSAVKAAGESTEKVLKLKMAEDAAKAAAAAAAAVANAKKEKPRWGISQAKKPYVKQSEKDPVYQERLTRIKKKNWLKEKGEALVHRAALATDTGTESEDGRRFNNHYDARNEPRPVRLPKDDKAEPFHGKQKPSITNTNNTRDKAKLKQKQKKFVYSEFEIPEIRLSSPDVQIRDVELTTIREREVILRQEQYDLRENEGPVRVRQKSSEIERRISARITDEDETVNGSNNSAQMTVVKSQKKHKKETVEETHYTYNNNDRFQESSVQENSLTCYSSNNPSRIPTDNTKSSSPIPRNTQKDKITINRDRDRVPVPTEVDDHTVKIPSRPQSPPVPALAKSLQQGIDPEEFVNSATYQLSDKVTVDSTPPATSVNPANPIITSNRNQANLNLNQQKTSNHNHKHHVHHKHSTHRIDTPVNHSSRSHQDGEFLLDPKSASTLNQTETFNNADYTNYYTDYISPPIVSSPRGVGPQDNYLEAYDGPLSGRPSTRDSEFSQRRRLITSLMSHDEVQEQLSARESELSTNGIIEFSIHLPPIYNQRSPNHPSNDLIVTTKFNADADEKTIQCSQPSSVSPPFEYEMDDYKDPLESERKRATVRWLYSNSDQNEPSTTTTTTTAPYLLTHLSSLKRGIQRQQYEWNTMPVEDLCLHSPYNGDSSSNREPRKIESLMQYDYQN